MALKNIATTVARKGDYSTAASFLEKALDLAPQIPDSCFSEFGDISSLGTIASAITEINDPTIAVSLLDKALDLTREIKRGIKSEQERTNALRSLAKTIIQINDSSAVASLLDKTLTRASEIQYRLYFYRVWTLTNIAIAYAKAGFSQQALNIVPQILSDRDRYLPEIAATFMETNDKAAFKQLLIPCAYYSDAAYLMCGYLARLYPEQAVAISAKVKAID